MVRAGRPARDLGNRLRHAHVRGRVRSRLAFAASVLVHAIAIALAMLWRTPGMSRLSGAEDEAKAPAAPGVVEPSLVEVVLLPAEDSAGGAGESIHTGRIEISPRRGELAASATGGETRGAGTADTTGTTGDPDAGTGVAGEPGTGTSTSTGALRMRGRRHDLSIPSSVLERLARESKPLAPAVRPSGLLEPSGRGTHAIDDEVVSIRVRPDGTVAMKAKPDFTIELALPVTSFEELRQFLGAMLTEWYRDPYAIVRANARDERLGRIEPMDRPCELKGDPICDSPAATSGGGLPLFNGKLDITSYLMRKTGVGDAYSSRKLKLLDDTRAERIQLGAAHRAEQLARSAELVRRNLDALERAALAPAARRAALFALWDECAEGEDLAGRAGELARAMVIGWIRQHLPEDGPDAFAPDEITRLDAGRTSHQHFAPYREPAR